MLLLLEHLLSSYVQKVKIVFREKQVSFSAEIPEHLGSGRSDNAFKAASPRTEVPVLIDEDARILGSMIVKTYNEEHWPKSSLLPCGPAAATDAFARIAEDVCDTRNEAVRGFGGVVWYKRATGELAGRLKSEAPWKMLPQTWLTGRLATSHWFGG